METSPTDLLVDAIAVAVIERLQPLLDELSHPEPSPALLTRAQLARQLGCSLSKVDGLCRQGMPHVRVGDCKRFRLQAVLEWLEHQNAVDRAAGGRE